jgi:uncharacterized protein
MNPQGIPKESLPRAAGLARIGATIRGIAMTHIIRFGTNPPPAESGRPDNILEGNPETRLLNYYTDKTGQFFAGIWECTPGKWRVSYAEEEFCAILDGRAILTDAAGKAETVKAGDAFVIPKGFAGTWETVEKIRKWYVIFEPKK